MYDDEEYFNYESRRGNRVVYVKDSWSGKVVRSSKERQTMTPDGRYYVNPSPHRVMRDRQSYPYSYDPFFHWGHMNTKREGVSADYSDRLYQFNWDAANKADAVFRKRFCTMSSVEISDWMTIYRGKPTIVVALAEGCNVINGYPYYVVWWRDAIEKISENPVDSENESG